MSGQQLSVNLPSSVVADGDGGGGGGPEEDETKTFIFQYLSRRAQNDKELPKQEAGVIQEQSEEAVRTTTAGTDSTDAASNVACKLADLGELV